MRWVGLLVALYGCAPPAEPLPIPAIDAIIRTCVMQSSCLGDPYFTVSRCVETFEGSLRTGSAIFFGPESPMVRRYVDCAARSADCASAIDCASLGYGADYCAHNPGITCDRDVVVYCAGSGGNIFNDDCAARGSHCRVIDGRALCTDGCSCTPTTYDRPICDGDNVIYCTRGIREVTHCPTWLPGSGCRQDYSGGWSSRDGCRFHGAPCAGAARCEGDVVVSCNAGEELRIDCTELEARCQAAGCVFTATECKEADADVCDGASLSFCVHGRQRTFPCASIGRSTCTVNTQGEGMCL